MGVKHVIKWRREFENGRTDIYDHPTGHSSASRADVKAAWVEKWFGISDESPLKTYYAAFHNNEEVEVEMVVCEWLRMHEPDLYRDGIFKLGPRWEKLICSGIMLKNNDIKWKADPGGRAV